MIPANLRHFADMKKFFDDYLRYQRHDFFKSRHDFCKSRHDFFKSRHDFCKSRHDFYKSRYDFKEIMATFAVKMTIQVTYRRTRQLSMRIVKNGDVHVSAPFGMTKEDVVRFVEDNREWIAKARKQTLERNKTRAAFYNQLQINDAATYSRIQELIEPMVERNAQKIGVRPSAVTYKPMISRWGMCNVKTRSVCFSVYLLLLPEWCVEHVVVHELCHLLEPSHNARFHALMDHYFPRWREARKETRRIVNN